MDDRRRAEPSQDGGRLRRALGAVRRDADIERLPLPHRRVEGAHGLLQRGIRIDPMGIEDVDIVQPHALEALVEAGEKILAAAPFTVRPGPHAVAGLGRNDQFVAIRLEIRAQHLAEERLGRAGRRAVIVGEIEMGDAHVEGGEAHLPRPLDRIGMTEVLPEPQGYRGQEQSAATGSAVLHGVVALGGGLVTHRDSSRGFHSCWGLAVKAI